MTAPRRIRREVVDERRGVFMISVAAELAEMHPQTLRMYEARGLITPKRSPKNTRLYSHADVERLRRIQQMTAREGLNLAGVEIVLRLEQRLDQMRAEVRRMRARSEQIEREMAELEQVRASVKAELVPYGAYQSDLGGPGMTSETSDPVRVPIKRRRDERSRSAE